MKRNNLIIFVIIILALFGFIFYPWVILPIKNISQNITSPVDIFFSNKFESFSSFFSKFGSISKIDKENESLVQENLDLKAKISEMEELKHENEILREELNFTKDKNKDNLMPAEIVSYSPNSYTKSIKLNKGNRDGVKKNQAVISSGFLVGIVSEVYDNSCDVLFITDSTSLITVILQNSRANGLLKGGLQGLIIEEIPLDSQISEGETVLTNNLSGDFPDNIPVGKIKKIISAESEVFQKAQLESPVKFSNLEIVFIVK